MRTSSGSGGGGGGAEATTSSQASSAALNASSRATEALPSYSQAMEQVVEVHSPAPSIADNGAHAAGDLHNEFRKVSAWKDKPLRQGDVWYVVNIDWIKRWTTLCQSNVTLHEAKTSLGRIDNEALFDIDDKELKRGLQENVDFNIMPKQAWKFLTGRYGFVKEWEIERQVIKLIDSETLRIEYYPPTLQFSTLTADHVDVETQFACKFSVTKRYAEVKEKMLSKAKEVQSPTFDALSRTEFRLWRLPSSLETPVKLDELATAEGKELLQPLSDQLTLAELQVDSIIEKIFVESKTNGAWILQENGKRLNALKGIFAQDVNQDSFSRLQNRDRSPRPSSPSSSSLFGRITRSQTAAERNGERTRGLTGLYNLGNTCFMNAALQCMSNTKELKDYFVSGVYKSEINPSNPLGMGGAMAKVFGELLARLWGAGGGSAWHPREFKTVLSRFSPTFIGYAQQDSQELLAFLLDGLHEDLNRIVKKPYIEAPDWESGGLKEMVAFAHKQWEIYKLRNDSVIVDLFQGQYRSTLVCPDCQKVSIKFDPFMYLTLPIPNIKTFSRNLTFVNKDRKAFSGEIRLTSDTSFEKLKEKIAKQFNVKNSKTLVACDIYQKQIYRVFQDHEMTSDIHTNDLTYIYELDSPLRATPPYATKPRTTFSHTSLVQAEEMDDEVQLIETGSHIVLPLYTISIEAASRSYRGQSGGLGQPLFISIPVDQANDVEAVTACVMQAYMQLSKDGAALQAFFQKLDAKVESKAAANGNVEDWDMMDDSNVIVPSIRNADTESIVAEINEDDQSVKMVPDVQAEQNTEAPLHYPIIAENAEQDSRPTLSFFFRMESEAPFPLKAEGPSENLYDRAARLGLTNSQVKQSHVATQWPLVYAGGGLVCVWQDEVADRFFDISKNNSDGRWWLPSDVLEDEDSKTVEAKRLKKTLSIEDCLNEFTKEERLGESDPWYCPQCKEFKQASKKFDLWKVPDILVVHFKRFSSGRYARDKIDNFIDFPIDGLDLTDRVEGAKAIRLLREGGQANNDGEHEDDDDCMMDSIGSLDANDDAVEADAPIYDLYAVDNHYGGLGGGHYTAYAKNPDDGKWYDFDDSHVRPIPNADSVKTAAAYLLFYRRRTTRPIGGKSREKIQMLGSANHIDGNNHDDVDSSSTADADRRNHSDATSGVLGKGRALADDAGKAGSSALRSHLGWALEEDENSVDLALASRPYETEQNDVWGHVTPYTSFDIGTDDYEGEVPSLRHYTSSEEAAPSMQFSEHSPSTRSVGSVYREDLHERNFAAASQADRSVIRFDEDDPNNACESKKIVIDQNSILHSARISALATATGATPESGIASL